MTEDTQLKLWQERLDISPFQRWLGLRAESAGEGEIEISLLWREELVSNPANKSMHGGILASVIDLGGLYAVLTTKSAAVATVDLRVDYHRPVSAGQLRAVSKVLRLGTKVSSAETAVFDDGGRLVASGRGVYLMG